MSRATGTNTSKNGEDALEDADNIYRLIKPTRSGPMDVLDAPIGYNCLWLVEFVITGSDHRMPPTITCDVLGKAAGLMSPTILGYLLNILDCTITTEILRIVAKNNGCGMGMVEMLLDKNPDCEITVAVLESAASDGGCGVELVGMLLNRDPDLQDHYRAFGDCSREYELYMAVYWSVALSPFRTIGALNEMADSEYFDWSTHSFGVRKKRTGSGVSTLTYETPKTQV